MFANFTQETCTGTGDTLTLAGAPAGAIPFSVSFSDGDLVSYALEDSGGSIKITGIGTYVSATNAITRNDTWNYNGTVVDQSPSTNITLSGGTHTIRCDAIRDSQSLPLWSNTEISPRANSGYTGSNHNQGIATATITANKLYLCQEVIEKPTVIRSLAAYCSTAGGAGAKARLSVWRIDGVDTVKDLVCESDVLDVSTTGHKKTTLATPVYIPAGIYRFGFICDDATAAFYSHTRTKGPVGICPVEFNQLYCYQGLNKLNVTGWDVASMSTLGLEGYTASLDTNNNYPVVLFNFN